MRRRRGTDLSLVGLMFVAYWVLPSGVLAEDTCHWEEGFHIFGLSGPGEALAVYDDGMGPHLFAAGHFVSADESAANYIARWDDGDGWSPLGSGMNIAVYSLAVYDDGGGPALYAGGPFSFAGGVLAQGWRAGMERPGRLLATSMRRSTNSSWWMSARERPCTWPALSWSTVPTKPGLLAGTGAHWRLSEFSTP